MKDWTIEQEAEFRAKHGADLSTLSGKYTHKKLQDLHELSHNNRDLLETQDKCGCYYCREIFPTKEITTWADDGQTAVCPYCHVDSVICDNQLLKITPDLLEDGYVWWFCASMPSGEIEEFLK